MKSPILVVVGTRPDAIKLIPVYMALKKIGMIVKLCATFQHDKLLLQVLDIFNIKPDISLSIMETGQDLFYLTSALITNLKKVFLEINPSCVIVQGDTTTSFCAALAAYYLSIKIAHIEAGLRTGNLKAPFPEEANRRFISVISDFNFSATPGNTQALLKENIDPNSIYCVGNTGIDALYWIEKQLECGSIKPTESLQQLIFTHKKNNNKIVLLTAHRRESFGQTLHAIFSGIAAFLKTHRDVTIFYPTHPNPHVLEALNASGLRNEPNILILEPLAYHDLIALLLASNWVVTDSGGIQEEAASLGKLTLVLRTVTERNEGIDLGLAKLAGTNSLTIQKNMHELYSMQNLQLPRSTIYGDGFASIKIASLIAENFIFQKKQDKNQSTVHS